MADGVSGGRNEVTVFASFSGEGGVERMLVNLARGLRGLDCGVRLLVARDDSAWLHHLPADVEMQSLGSQHTFTALGALAAILRREQLPVLLVAKHRAIKTAILARLVAAADVRLVGRLGTNVSAALAGSGPVKRALWHAGMRLFYRGLDGLVVVSEGVREDVAAITGIDPARIRVIPNPVITPELVERGREPPPHPWLERPRGEPVIIGVGRLTRQKDFATLVAAFARLNARTPARLIILGEGRYRGALLHQVAELGIGDRVSLPGFMDNPHAWVAHADLFVLSSRWEGSPNALTEALALGTPVVATDCPSGPAELLAGGRVAPLVAVGDEQALAAAMLEVLAAPPDPGTLRDAVSEYTMEKSAARYLAFLRELEEG